MCVSVYSSSAQLQHRRFQTRLVTPITCQVLSTRGLTNPLVATRRRPKLLSFLTDRFSASCVTGKDQDFWCGIWLRIPKTRTSRCSDFACAIIRCSCCTKRGTSQNTGFE